MIELIFAEAAEFLLILEPHVLDLLFTFGIEKELE